MNNDTAMHANDLTQLSSREQLSALMDGALPPDETRFLLRRLRHDAPLAECWERWRLTGEVMRGLAPAQRLPADFATRVGAALHGTAAQPVEARRAGTPAWLRWGGGAAMAASFAVAALVLGQPAADMAGPKPAAIAMAATAGSAPVQQAPAARAADTPVLAAAGALAAAARPGRASRRSADARARMQSPAAASRDGEVASAQEIATINATDAMPMMQPHDIVTRPWPRSVLPQYASDGLTVGFGNHGSAAYNPFPAQAAIGNVPADAGAREAPNGTPVRSDDNGEPLPR